MASADSIRPFAAAIASSPQPAIPSARPRAALVRVWVSRPRASWARHHWTNRSGWPMARYALPSKHLDAVRQLVAVIAENRLGGVAVADSRLDPSGHPALRRDHIQEREPGVVGRVAGGFGEASAHAIGSYFSTM